MTSSTDHGPTGAGGSAGVRFLIVGTPRSGTTLVQRLACEIPGVAVPFETHFFPRFVLPILRSSAAPPTLDDLRRSLAQYGESEVFRGADFDPVQVLAEAETRRPSVFDLFDRVVRGLAGEAPVVGEKTPLHLSWWRPITQVRPDIKIVAVIRDPRAVVSSNLVTPWARQPWAQAWGSRLHLLFALKWAFDEGEIAALQAGLGPQRSAVLRYEDVVFDPAGTRRRLATLLDLPLERVAPPSQRFVHDWETWKHSATGPIEAARATAWQGDERLSKAGAEEVAALCWRGMARRGYGHDGLRTTARAVGRILTGASVAEARRLHLEIHDRRTERAAVNRLRAAPAGSY